MKYSITATPPLKLLIIRLSFAKDTFIRTSFIESKMPMYKGKIVSAEELKRLTKLEKEAEKTAAKAAGKTVKAASTAGKTSADLFNEKSLEEITSTLNDVYLEKKNWNIETNRRIGVKTYEEDSIHTDPLSYAKVLTWDGSKGTATNGKNEYDFELTEGLLNDSGKIGLRSPFGVGSIVAIRQETAKMRKTVREGTFGVSTLVDRWVNVTHYRVFALIPADKINVFEIPESIKPSSSVAAGGV
jgi:ribosomal protein L18